jgi:hypothetical protein
LVWFGSKEVSECLVWMEASKEKKMSGWFELKVRESKQCIFFKVRKMNIVWFGLKLRNINNVWFGLAWRAMPRCSATCSQASSSWNSSSIRSN